MQMMGIYSKLGAGAKLGLSVVFAVISGLATWYCSPLGINHSFSYNGFFFITCFFFIISTMQVFKVGEEEVEDDLPACISTGMLQLITGFLIMNYAAVADNFETCLLWGAVDLVFFFLGFNNVCHFVYSMWKLWSEEWTAFKMQRQNRKAESAIIETLRAEEAEQRKNAEMEDKLVADLGKFLSDSDIK
jgi:hypothetical protein